MRLIKLTVNTFQKMDRKLEKSADRKIIDNQPFMRVINDETPVDSKLEMGITQIDEELKRYKI